MLLEFILGMGILSALLLLLAHILGQKDEEGQQKNPVLRFIAILFFIFSLFFIPSYLVSYPNNCDIVIANITTTDSQYNLSYEYKEFCTNNTNTIPTTFLSFTRWFVTVFIIFLFIVQFEKYIMLLVDIVKNYGHRRK